MRQGGHRILCEMISQPQVISAQVIKAKNQQDTIDRSRPNLLQFPDTEPRRFATS
jgi:hypothetical protein